MAFVKTCTTIPVPSCCWLVRPRLSLLSPHTWLPDLIKHTWPSLTGDVHLFPHLQKWIVVYFPFWGVACPATPSNSCHTNKFPWSLFSDRFLMFEHLVNSENTGIIFSTFLHLIACDRANKIFHLSLLWVYCGKYWTCPIKSVFCLLSHAINVRVPLIM